jgi:hypothetical protein
MEDGLVRVPIGTCTCPGTPHADGDEVYLRPKLGMARALAVIRGAAVDDVAVAEMQLAIGYTRFGIADWNLSNGDGRTMPIDGDHLAKFAEDDPRSILVALKGDELYAKEVVVPLVTMAAVSSQTSPATGETSATTGTASSTKRRKRSKRSSTTTTQTDGTVTITASLDGDSSS